MYLYLKNKKVNIVFYPMFHSHRKQHRHLEGSQASLICPSGNSKMWMTKRTEH